MFEIFGFQIKKKDTESKLDAIVVKSEPDSSSVVAAGGSYGQYLDLDSSSNTEADLVKKYREVSRIAEIDSAIEEIVNEFVDIEDEEIISIDYSPDVDPKIQKIITIEFEEALRLLDFKNSCYNLIRTWYVDGRLKFQAVIKKDSPSDGLQDVRYIDPRKLKKVKEIKQSTDNKVVIDKVVSEYYIYSEKGFGSSVANNSSTPENPYSFNRVGIKISKDSIIDVPSGLTDVNNLLVLSYIDKAIKPINQLKTLEDASIIYTLARAPSRRVWYIDVAGLPPAKAKQHLNEQIELHKNKLVYNAETGNVRDDRKFMCYALDTKIPLLDGRTVELSTLIEEHEAGKKNWVYSCDIKTGKFVPGPISWAGVTKKNAEVVKITFDNGESIICTPDHKFPVWHKGFVEAKDLIGESIIPGYRRKASIYEGGKKYEQIFKNDTKKWEFVHREVSRWKNENNIKEEMLYDIKYSHENKQTIHHKNCNNLDNSPNNLVLMNRYDHLKYHAEQARYNFKPNKSSDFTPEWRAKLSAKAKLRQSSTIKTWKITTPNNKQIIIENLNEYCRKENLNRTNIKGKYGSRGYHAEALKNHKAVSIEYLKNAMDVGCITIDLEETYHSHHTYLLDAGVYTKNTMLEDYYLPRRGDSQRGTEVTTLQGDTMLGRDMSQIEYFEKKLYKALNVPTQRLQESDVYALGRSTQITREEVKFAKFIARLRLNFSMLFLQIMEKNLILKGKMSAEDWTFIKAQISFAWSSANYFEELKEAEVIKDRANSMDVISPYIGVFYSKSWARKNILKMTDEQIEEEDKQIEEERETEFMQQSKESEEQQNDNNINNKENSEDKPKGDNKETKIQQAKTNYDKLKPKENRSQDEQAKFRSSAQILGKNKR